MPTVRKVLMHGFCILPVGQLTEEAQEARNKYRKRFRERNTRKISRIGTDKDLLHLRLIFSDPVISSLRNLLERKFVSFSAEVLA
jgi:hypothetical protein